MIRNSTIIGKTMLNSNGQSSRGIITPKVGNIRIDHIRFHNFGGGTRSLETCSGC